MRDGTEVFWYGFVWHSGTLNLFPWIYLYAGLGYDVIIIGSLNQEDIMKNANMLRVLMFTAECIMIATSVAFTCQCYIEF